MELKQKYRVNGGKKVFGELKVPASKNAILPILAGTIIAKGVTTLKNCPYITDIDNMLILLEEVGAKVERNDRDIMIDSTNVECGSLSKEVCAKFRSSIFMLGAMMSRCRFAKVYLPGGCAIGSRGIDLHLDALRQMGVVVREEEDFVFCDGTNMHSADIYLKFASVGATENIMMASVLTKGTTTITNAACEPEIVDLANFLNVCGARVVGAGTSFISITGVKRLHTTQYEPIPDRIVAGSYLAFCAINNGKIRLDNAIANDLVEPINVLKQMGCDVLTSSNAIKLQAPERLKAVNRIRTNPYPDFPTDLQSIFMSLLAVSEGKSVIEENVFENRFHNAGEINKLGGKVEVVGSNAYIHGTNKLSSGALEGKDLRGTMGLLVLASAINGVSTIGGAQYVERGYEDLESNLSKIGIDIVRVR